MDIDSKMGKFSKSNTIKTSFVGKIGIGIVQDALMSVDHYFEFFSKV